MTRTGQFVLEGGAMRKRFLLIVLEVLAGDSGLVIKMCNFFNFLNNIIVLAPNKMMNPWSQNPKVLRFCIIKNSLSYLFLERKMMK